MAHRQKSIRASFIATLGLCCAIALGGLSGLGTSAGSLVAQEAASHAGGVRQTRPLDPTSPWPKFRGDMEQTGRARFIPESDSGAPFWSFQTGKGIFSSPVVDSDGTIFVGSADRYFYAITPDGQLKWRFRTGEIIDSAAMLDDTGHVYIGAGDGVLRAFNRTDGEVLWAMRADAPKAGRSFINWFEGNVGMTKNGVLIVPNDNFHIYGVDRKDGRKLWQWEMNDQVWALPAVDPLSQNVYVGDNFIAGLDIIGWFYKNISAMDPWGRRAWRFSAQGSVGASPMLAGERVIYASFDGYVRALDKRHGMLLWEFAARDHLYASPALLSDGTVIQASTDGSVYALDGATGHLRWTFDTLEPIRSSPAIDGLDRIYFGSGNGRLYVLNPDGSRRYSMQLIAQQRRNLNSSVALGLHAAYIGGESGELFSVPYDYCLKPAGAADPRCLVAEREDLPAEGAHLYYVSPYGGYQAAADAVIDANQPLTFLLMVREKNATVLSLIDDVALKVNLQPAIPITTHISGDRRFVTIVPQKELAADTVTLNLSGIYLQHPLRQGLRFEGGIYAGRFSKQFTFKVDHGNARDKKFLLPIPTIPGEPSGMFEFWRFTLPQPTVLPSYNQIGFDSMHYLAGMVEGESARAIGWIVGARLNDDNEAVPDPATKVLFPVEVTYDNGLLTMNNTAGFVVNAMNFDMPFDQFRLSAHISHEGEQLSTPVAFARTNCTKVPTYGVFLIKLGFCNLKTSELAIFGSYNIRPHAIGQKPLAAKTVGRVNFVAERDLLRPWLFRLRAEVKDSGLDLARHTLSLLVIDSASGKPAPLRYGLATSRKVSNGGTDAKVQLEAQGTLLPAKARVYLMIDTYPAAVTHINFTGILPQTGS